MAYKYTRTEIRERHFDNSDIEIKIEIFFGEKDCFDKDNNIIESKLKTLVKRDSTTKNLADSITEIKIIKFIEEEKLERIKQLLKGDETNYFIVKEILLNE